jgi:FkbH-like protein
MQAGRDAALADCAEIRAARQAAVAERDAALANIADALAARDAAIVERDAALAARDAALAERRAALTDDYVQMFFGQAALRDFQTPTQLALSTTPAKRVLVIGSCFAEGIAIELHRTIPGCEYDLLLCNHYTELPPEPPRPISEYDFQVVLLPLRSIMPERQHMRLDYADVASYQSFYEDSVARLHQLLDGALAYSRRFDKLSFVVNFLVPQQNPLGRLLPASDLRNPAYFCRQLNAELEKAAGALRDVHVVDVDGLAAGFGQRWVQDDFLWSFSHGAFASEWDWHFDGNRLERVPPITKQVPFLVQAFIGAVWREVAAMYRTLRQVDPIKMVVVDLDDTMWRGVAADAQGLDATMLEGWPLGFIEALQYVKKRGVLLAVITKNERQLIEKIWPDLCAGAIEMSDFAAMKINWLPKPENMEELLNEVNLLPRNVLFIDDNPVERAAMTAAFPDLRVIGANPYEHRRLLLWSPELQVPIVTDESLRRTEMVQAQVDREHSRRRMSRSEFLASLALKFRLTRLATADGPQFGRAFELLNKTNQFNTTGRRWTLAEIEQALAAGTRLCVFDVADKYTRYGLVGVVLMKGDTFEQFVMSCRVVGLDAEVAAIAILAREVVPGPAGRVRAVTRETDANLLSRDLWRRCGFDRQGDHWTADVSSIVALPPHIELLAEPELATVA